MGNQTWTIKRHSQHPSQYTEGRQIKTNYTKQKIKTMSNRPHPNSVVNSCIEKNKFLIRHRCVTHC